jgi:hypothetical protein
MDKKEIQWNRITQAVRKRHPDYVVQPDSDQPPDWIRFRIENELGLNLTQVHPHYRVDEITDWSDARLQETLEALLGSFGKRAGA